MIRFVLSRIGYGLLVLWGVVTVVFFLFHLSPGDPVRNLVGENASSEMVENIRRKLDLDLPSGKRYVYYLNDLSPISVYTLNVEGGRRNWDPEVQGGWKCIALSGNNILVLKPPYFKRSFLSDRSVTSILLEAMPGTAVLAVSAISLALLFGLLLGIFASLNKDSAADRTILFVSALGMAGPSFFMAILIAWLGAVVWRDHVTLAVWPLLFLIGFIIWSFLKRKNGGVKYAMRWGLSIVGSWIIFTWIIPSAAWNPHLTLPGTGLDMTGSLYSVSVWEGAYVDLRNLILPAITLAIRPLAVIVQLTRSSMLEVLSLDYIRTARAKGLSERRVVFVHALRNAVNPVITAVSGWFASLLAGAVFVEFVFGWKGLGQEMFLAIEKQDMPVVMGGVILIAAVFVVINLLVDVAYGWIDPRVRRA